MKKFAIFKLPRHVYKCFEFVMSIRMRMRNAFERRINAGKHSVQRLTENTVEGAFHGGMFSLFMVSLVWIAIFLYVVFYYAYIPAPSYVRPIHLQVEPCNDSQKVCIFPSAHVRLTRRYQLLMMGQPYKFLVQLEMPESPVNQQLGMFMVCVQLKDKNGFLTSQSCRSNMLHYHSDLLHKLKILFLSPLYIMGNKEEKQTVLFELYTDFEEDQKHPVTDIYVEVQAHHIEIYSATLIINAHLVGLRYLMYHWPVSSAVVGILFNLCVVFFTVSLSFYHNFFVDSAALQLMRARLRQLETRTDQFLNEHSLVSRDDSTENIGEVASAFETLFEASTSEKVKEEAVISAQSEDPS